MAGRISDPFRTLYIFWGGVRAGGHEQEGWMAEEEDGMSFIGGDVVLRGVS